MELVILLDIPSVKNNHIMHWQFHWYHDLSFAQKALDLTKPQLRLVTVLRPPYSLSIIGNMKTLQKFHYKNMYSTIRYQKQSCVNRTFEYVTFVNANDEFT